MVFQAELGKTAGLIIMTLPSLLSQLVELTEETKQVEVIITPELKGYGEKLTT